MSQHRGTTRLRPEPPVVVEGLSIRYARVRRASLALIAGLSGEDCALQSMPDASPLKWHLAHTTWFFETFVLDRHAPGYPSFHPAYRYLYNSYYNAVGEQFPRAQRGLMSRPALNDILRYREHVDACMTELLAARPLSGDVLTLVELGLQHEQQHQELMLTDFKHLLSLNPLAPAYVEGVFDRGVSPPAMQWATFKGGIVEIGHAGEGFAFDNESPRHRQYVAPFSLAARPVTNGEYLEFIEDGGYQEPALWLSEGWAVMSAQSWRMPGYWRERDGVLSEFTLKGLQPLDLARPVTHVSHFEADAYARWASAHLPTEFEWELAAAGVPVRGNFVESGELHPRSSPQKSALSRDLTALYGDVWEWTQSSYAPYPGYRVAPGAVGEYNGKFMSNQYVLRGGSCATPQSHMRMTYRNFFPSGARWQFSGIRLARDLA
jgi:ergothioneine biosynthesis protein EgtB